MTDAVLLRVNGVNFGGWKEVEISAGIERAARDFTLSVTRNWPGETSIPRRVAPGDVCEIFIGSDKVLTGYIDATPIRYDAQSVSVGVRGRSKTADLGDCSARHKTGQWRNSSIERIASDLAAPYGVAVVSEADTGGNVLEHQIQPGETVFESIDRLLTLRQLLATDDAQGRLVFINPGNSSRAQTALKLGDNVLSADAALDYKDVFTEYLVQGQRSGNDNDSGATVAEVSATATDAAAGRQRMLIIRQNGQVTTADCARRAKYEQAYRKAKALEAVYTVQGWRQSDGSLWIPNQMVRVVDPVIGFDYWMLIVEVVYRLSESGMTATLKVGPVDGYIPAPEAAKKEKAKKAGKGGDAWADVSAAQ